MTESQYYTASDGWPHIRLEDGRDIRLGYGVDTGIKLTDDEIMACLEPIKRFDFIAASQRCQDFAYSKGLPKLPEGKRYSFGQGRTFTVVPDSPFNHQRQ